MSPFSGPVLGGAAIISSPALWGALVDGTTSPQEALTRYLVVAVIVWMGLGAVAMLVGPPPRPQADPDGEGPGGPEGPAGSGTPGS